jgi:cytochrome oxidase Cu insertion factor (SCO1/SenC/PrrC family)
MENDRKTWKYILKADKISDIGVHLMVDKKRQFIKDYGITATSYTILIDHRGRIVEAGAPSLSDPKLIDLLEEQKRL